MQFEDKDSEKDNNDFSLNDSSNTISWEDLLNIDGNADISHIIKGDEETSKQKAKKPLEPANEDKAPYLKKSAEKDLTDIINTENDFSILDLDSIADNSPAGDNSGEIENSAEKNFDANSDVRFEPVSSLSSAAAEDIRAELGLDVTPGDFTGSFETDGFDILKKSDDVEIEDASGLVDDELLNILNEDKNPIENEELNRIDVKPDFFKTAREETQENFSKETQEDISPSVKKKPVLLLAVVILVCVFAAVFYLLTYVFVPSTDKDVSMTPEPGLNAHMPDDALNLKKTPESDITGKPDKPEAPAADKNEPVKKEIIAVKFAGRANPFVPSSMFDENGFASIDADLSAPPDIMPNSPGAIEARKLFTIGVSGIMYDPDKPCAILKYDNKDYFVQKGDRVDSYAVNQITKDYVVIGNGANTYKAYVGETFKTDETLPDINQMKYDNGSRQYISSDDIQISTK